MSIESTHSRSWVSDRAGFGYGLGMTYPHQDGCGGVAGGASPAPCPTPVAPFARVCATSRTSRGCSNPVKTMTLPMSSSGISISWRSLGTSISSVLRRLCVSFGLSSQRRFVRHATMQCQSAVYLCSEAGELCPGAGASKGQVWTRHSAPPAPAFPRPSSPSQFHSCLMWRGPGHGTGFGGDRF